MRTVGPGFARSLKGYPGIAPLLRYGRTGWLIHQIDEFVKNRLGKLRQDLTGVRCKHVARLRCQLVLLVVGRGHNQITCLKD
jgi:hypothetical protein